MSISSQFFTPTQIPDSVFWFDASDTSTMSFSGSSVTQWRDKSGNSRHANQNTAATFSTNSLVFSGSQYYTVANAANLFRNVYFAIFVVEAQSGVNPTSFFLGDSAGGVTSGSLHIGYRTNSNLTMAFWNADLEITGLSGTGIRRLWSFILPGNANRFANLNGSTVATYGNNSFLTAMSSLLIGSAFAYDFYRGSLFEVVGFTGTLTLPQIQRMEGYLAWKWGLRGNLPSTHPYANSPLSLSLRLSNQIATSQTRTFTATGSIQTLTIPPGVSVLKFYMWGAGGGNQDNSSTIRSDGGGSGAYLEGNIFVTPGTILNIIVGVCGGTGLANGGGAISRYGGSGGGFSGIFSGSPSAATVLAIAGGGGGSGVNGGGNGGGGGYPSGLSGTGVTTGGGGTQSAGGSGAISGTQFAGANGQQTQGGGGGAGGGGWYGGGSAADANPAGGGGGGSSTYTASVSGVVSINGNVGIRTTGSNTPAPNESSPFWVSPYGRSAANGYVVITYSPAAARIFLSSPTPSTVVTFSYTGANQTFIVPPGVLFIMVYMWGAGGGGGGSGGIGAAGAMIQGILRVNVAQVLTVIVGQGGAIGRSSYGGGGSGNGFGGGAAGGGGGRSALILDGTEVATAGGGGGGGNGSNARGGAATFSGTALDGTGANGGKGASQTAGGAAGGNFGSPGGARVGGKGEGLGGGGGGGYFGGGGAGNNSDASGGGGSSFTTNLSLLPGQTVFGFNSSDGQSAPNTTSPYYASGVGTGAIGQGVSGNGRVVIIY